MKRHLIVLASLAIAGSAGAETITVSGSDAFEVSQKTTCGTLDEATPRYGVFEGRAYSRVPGEKEAGDTWVKVSDPVSASWFSST